MRAFFAGFCIALAAAGAAAAPGTAPERRPAAAGERLALKIELVGDKTPGEGPAIAGTNWVAEEIGGRPVVPIARSMMIIANGQVGGVAGCNRFFGKVTVGDGAIAFGALGSTRLSCAAPVMEQERALFAALAAAAAFAIEDGRLDLKDASGAVLARFAPE